MQGVGKISNERNFHMEGIKTKCKKNMISSNK
jgi:hypothetical protein